MNDDKGPDYQPVSLFDLELQEELATCLETVNPDLAASIRKILKAGGSRSKILEDAERAGATPFLLGLMEVFINQQVTSDS